MRRFIKTSLLACALLFIPSCKTTETASRQKWAHYPVEQSIGSINARLSFLEMGFETDYDSIKVCLQGSSSFNGNALSLDVQLAFAAWLDSSGQGNERMWSRFQFISKDICETSDVDFSAVVIIGSPEKLKAGQKYEDTLQPIHFLCSRSSGICQTDAVVGAGQTGAVGYANDETNPNLWTFVSNQGPAMVQLSPYVQWASLEQDLANGPASTTRTNLLNNYRSLLTKAGTLPYASLLSMNNALRAAALVAARDLNFDAKQTAFINSGRSSLDLLYTPNQGAFHTLLHEVGHQYGMQHADDPGSEGVTGSAGDAQMVRRKWVTSQASMAYADAYLYLTKDDVAGVADIYKSLLAYIRSHRGS